ncbi:hypothetical protein BHU72_00100 [Desulfuribacillus stibiiarsenatis]|uniref:NodB homology domain-containing protein n=1 Tax=Desulfuribacillus stibiiarsenatis TaxID=1390249 RepID=A0A1E5L989_9FIRM|nr:polysaccharide deacetylase family protein [Desulfuribacillus stibiiarsenatis]OEH86715.1 hypothetical protein BHU72_00100 [Desulfuribacillus stibiiarsenatis]
MAEKKSVFYTSILSFLIIFSVLAISLMGYILWQALQTELVSQQTVTNVAPSVEEQADADVENIAGENPSLLENNELAIDQVPKNSAYDTGAETHFSHPILDQLHALLSEISFVVLTYHHIDPNVVNNPVSITPKHFQEQLIALEKSPYAPITYEQLTQFIKVANEMRHLLSSIPENQSYQLSTQQDLWANDSLSFLKTLPKQGYHITFDDGYQSDFTYAYPALKDKRIPATFFIIVGYTKRAKEPTPEKLAFPHASWEEYRTINRHPLFQVQSHTFDTHSYELGVNNKRISALAGRVYRRELGRIETEKEYLDRIYHDVSLGKTYLENQLKPHRANGLSYPFGVYNMNVIRMAEKAGVEYMFTNQATLVTRATVQQEIPRVNVGDPTIDATKMMNMIDSLFQTQHDDKKP